MIIACATDSNFAELAGAMLRSIAVNGEVPEAEIVVCGDGLTAREKDWLVQSASGLKVRFVDVSDEYRARTAKFSTTRHETRSTFTRLLLPVLLPEIDGRILYLDVDVIVNASLRPLFDMPLNGSPVAGVPDAMDPDYIANKNRQAGRDENAPYVNSGVLLIDLARWRELDISDRCFEMLSWAPDLMHADQDALNAVAGDDMIMLDRDWNFYAVNARWFNRDRYAAAHIIHFISWRKPNLIECDHPARDIFLAHRAETPWRNEPLKTRRAKGFRAFLIQLLLKTRPSFRTRPATAKDIAAVNRVNDQSLQL